MKAKLAASLTPEACRAARGILGWSMRDLAREAGIAPATVKLIESARPCRPAAVDKIVAALDRHAVEITNDEGTGARLRMGAAGPRDDQVTRDLVTAFDGAATLNAFPDGFSEDQRSEITAAVMDAVERVWLSLSLARSRLHEETVARIKTGETWSPYKQ